MLIGHGAHTQAVTKELPASHHTIGEIIISDLAHHNESSLPYASSIDYSHSSDLRTMQNIFHVKATGGSSPYLGDAANANDLSDLFEPGVIPHNP